MTGLGDVQAAGDLRHHAWSQRIGNFVRLSCFAITLSAEAGPAPVADDGAAPQVRALLEQAWASEAGRGIRRNILLASALYGQAGRLGSAEGYYRAGRIQMLLGRNRVQRANAACLFSAASQLGHHAAQSELDGFSRTLDLTTLSCDGDYGMATQLAAFDLERYLSGLPPPRQQVAALIRRLAPLYGVEVRLALAVATVESNLDAWALSPKQAMGIMQLIPATAERFNVQKPFDAEQNIRGGLAYLRWLQRYFAGDTVRVVAAYNAGEKAVDRYSGIPPYDETIMYVTRVLGYAGRHPAGLPAPAEQSAAEAKPGSRQGKPGGSGVAMTAKNSFALCRRNE